MSKKSFYNLSEATRAEMMNKAMRLYVEHEYADITLKMILNALSLHPTTFYRFFENKDELYYVLLDNVARKRKAFLESCNKDYNADSFIYDNTSEPLNELEVEFVKTVATIPVNVLLHLYLNVFKDESVAMNKDRLRRMRYEGKLRPDIDDDLVSFIWATIPFNLVLFCRETGIEDEELQIKLNRYFFENFFRHGLMKDSEFSEDEKE